MLIVSENVLAVKLPEMFACLCLYSQHLMGAKIY